MASVTAPSPRQNASSPRPAVQQPPPEPVAKFHNSEESKIRVSHLRQTQKNNEDLFAARCQRDAVSLHLKAKEQEVQSLTARNRELGGAHDLDAQRLKANRAEIDALRNQLKEANQQFSLLSDQLKAANARCDELERQCKVFGRQIDQMGQRIDEQHNALRRGQEAQTALLVQLQKQQESPFEKALETALNVAKLPFSLFFPELFPEKW